MDGYKDLRWLRIKHKEISPERECSREEREREREKGRSTKGLKIQGIGREFKKIPP